MNPIKPPHNSPGASPSSSPEDNASTGGRHVRPVLLLLRPFTALLSAFMYIPGKIGQFVLRSFSPEKRLINRDTPMNQAGDQEKKTDRIMREKISTIVCAKGYSDEQREIIYQALNVITDIDSPEQIDMTLPDRILQHSDPLSAAAAVIGLKTRSEEVTGYREKILAHSNPKNALITVRNFMASREEHDFSDSVLNEILEKATFPARALKGCIELQKRELLNDKHKMQVLTHSRPDYMAGVLIALNEKPDLPAEFIDYVCSHSHHPAITDGLTKPLIMLGTADVEIMQSALDNNGFHSTKSALNILVEAKARGITIPSDFVLFIVKAEEHRLREHAAKLAIQLLELGITDVEILQLAYENNQNNTAEKTLTELTGKEPLKGYSSEQRKIIHLALNMTTDISGPEQMDMTLPDRILQHSDPLRAAAAVIGLKTRSEEVTGYREKILAHSNPKNALITVHNFMASREAHDFSDSVLNEILEKATSPVRALEACIELQKRELLNDKHKMQILTHEQPHYMVETLIALNGKPDLPAEFIDYACNHADPAITNRLIKPLIMLGTADVEIMESALKNGGFYTTGLALEILVEAKAKGMTIPSGFVLFIVKAEEPGREPAAKLAIQLLELGITDVKILQLACVRNQDNTAEKILTELIEKEPPASPEAVCDALYGHGKLD